MFFSVNMASASHGRIKEIQNLADFSQSLEDAGNKLVVVDFYATWFALFGYNIIYLNIFSYSFVL